MRLLKLNDNGSFSLMWYSKDKIPPYAILSHTWGRGQDDEVTFKDVINGTGENKVGFQKLQFCGNQAKDDDLHFFWVDTCCIDKSDTNELTTAINSMFRWYQNAARCYVYLSDVSVRSRDGKFVHVEWESAFRNSRWFMRGWTLQELLAPKVVDFYSRDQIRLGDKHSLGQRIVDITGIAIEALRGQLLSQFSIEERFSWAEKRQTTMEEDQAYCLLGIFGVFLPLIYGEGQSNAARRLRKEIRESIDTESKPTGNICRKFYFSIANFTPNASRPSKLQVEYFGGSEDNRNWRRTHLRGRRHEANLRQNTSIRADLILEASRRGSGMAMAVATTKDAYIAVMGAAGSGKSSFIELIVGRHIPKGHGLSLCTEDITSHSFMYEERLRVHLIEFPGFGDTYRSDVEVLKDIAFWLSSAYKKNVRLSGIIYLHPISDTRFGRSARQNLAMLQKLCGPGCNPNIIIASTRWDITDTRIGVAREMELVEREDYWGSMVSRGSVILRHSHSRQSAVTILERSIRTRRLLALQIQRELIDEGLCLNETEAGQEVNKALEREKEKNEQELKEATEARKLTEFISLGKADQPKLRYSKRLY